MIPSLIPTKFKPFMALLYSIEAKKNNNNKTKQNKKQDNSIMTYNFTICDVLWTQNLLFILLPTLFRVSLR